MWPWAYHQAPIWLAVWFLFCFFLPSRTGLPCTAGKEGILWCDTAHLAPPPAKPENSDAAFLSTNPGDDTLHLGNNINLSTLFGYSDTHTRTHRALELCEDNTACAHSILHHQALNPGNDCWVCKHMRHRHEVTPLSYTLINYLHYEKALRSDSTCSLPHSMLMILQIALARAMNDFSLFPPHNISCIDNGVVKTPNQTFLVPLKKAETCVCNSHGPHIGYSQCNVNIIIKNVTTLTCLITWKNGKTLEFPCPFKGLTSSPGLFWICGQHAFSSLSLEWTGCCFPAVVQPAISVYAIGKLPTNHTHRTKRSTYKGYIVADPFTSQADTVGWGIFPFGGLVAALQKINQLGVEILTLNGETTNSLAALNSEQFQIREAVIENRFVLDIVEARQGGMCRVLKTECCFFIENNYDNVSSAINRMRDAAREPLPADDLGAYLRNLGWGWISWVAAVVLPVVITLVLILSTLRCCIIPLVKRSVKQLFSSKQEILLTERDPEWSDLYPLPSSMV